MLHRFLKTSIRSYLLHIWHLATETPWQYEFVFCESTLPSSGTSGQWSNTYVCLFLLTGRSSGRKVHFFQVLHEEGAFRQIGVLSVAAALLCAAAHALLACSIELLCNISAWSSATRYQLRSASMISEQCRLKACKCFKANALDNLLW